jgi:hypothetical protein
MSNSDVEHRVPHPTTSAVGSETSYKGLATVHGRLYRVEVVP